MLGITVPQGEGGLVGQVAPAAEAAVDEEGEGRHTLGDGGAPAAREAVEQHVLPTEAKEQTGSRKTKNFDEVSEFIAKRVFKNAKVSQMQDVATFREKAEKVFNLWTQTFKRSMSANVHCRMGLTSSGDI